MSREPALLVGLAIAVLYGVLSAAGLNTTALSVTVMPLVTATLIRPFVTPTGKKTTNAD